MNLRLLQNVLSVGLSDKKDLYSWGERALAVPILFLRLSGFDVCYKIDGKVSKPGGPEVMTLKMHLRFSRVVGAADFPEKKKK